MIDQARISELRRIYGGSNNEAYRTVNQLLDEIERLNEGVARLNHALTPKQDKQAVDDGVEYTELGFVTISNSGLSVEEVSIEQPDEPIQLTELTEEIAQRVIEPAKKRRKQTEQKEGKSNE